MAEPDGEPVVARYRDLERRIWGDEESGRLPDWFSADSLRLNLDIVGMAPNGGCRIADGTRHSLYDMSHEPARCVVSVATGSLPGCAD